MLTAKNPVDNVFDLAGYCVKKSPASRVTAHRYGKFSVDLYIIDSPSQHARDLKRPEVVPWLRETLINCHEKEEGVDEANVTAALRAVAGHHLPFDYGIDERSRRVAELAPVVPPEFLKRIAPELPLVVEAAELIGNWYLYLSQILYEDAKAKMNPGVLDDYLDRMYDWLMEVRPHATQKLHGPKD